MMGQQASNQERLFYSFNLEEHVPADHLLRGIDRFLDLSALRQELAPFYSHTGRPSIDPELIVRMLLVGYCFGIRSERRLCEEVHLNLAYRWFCRLGLDDAVPDHSSFSKNRHGRFRESDAFRLVFEADRERGYKAINHRSCLNFSASHIVRSPQERQLFADGGTMSNLLAQVGLRIWRTEVARKEGRAVGVSEKSSPLSVSCGAAFRQAQNANLISRIYKLSGNGTLPISGGKVELGKRGKLFEGE